ncbi:MAG: hypothetical protein Kow0067_00360 [Coriobacteriia bacterium]
MAFRTTGTAARSESGESDSGAMRQVGAVVLVLLLLLLLVIWLWSQFTTVPDIVGLTETDAEVALVSADLELGDITTRTADAAAGEIVEQMPSPGSRVFKGSEIDVFVSAESMAGEPDEGPSAEKPEGGIDFPSGEEGTDDRFTIVAGSLSSGPTGPLVPDVQALTLADARSALRAAGYGVSVKYGPSTTGPGTGRVFYQNPAPNDVASRGSTVVIWIATGAPTEGFPYPEPD